MTPLNFVCKCRAPPPPRKRPAVFRKMRIEQIFSRACICCLFFTHCRNADELRVFVTRRCLLFSFARAARSPACARFRSRESARSNGFTKPKFFCGKPPEKALWPTFRGEKRTNWCRRFATATPAEAGCDAMRHPRAGDFRGCFGCARTTRGEIFRERAPTNVALKHRDASSGDR